MKAQISFKPAVEPDALMQCTSDFNPIVDSERQNNIKFMIFITCYAPYAVHALRCTRPIALIDWMTISHFLTYVFPLEQLLSLLFFRHLPAVLTFDELYDQVSVTTFNTKENIYLSFSFCKCDAMLQVSLVSIININTTAIQGLWIVTHIYLTALRGRRHVQIY